MEKEVPEVSPLSSKRKLPPAEEEDAADKALKHQQAVKEFYDFLNPYLTDTGRVPTLRDFDELARLVSSPHLYINEPGSGEEPSDSGEEAPSGSGKEEPSGSGKEEPSGSGEEAPSGSGEEVPSDDE
jgi:hypothetical protein